VGHGHALDATKGFGMSFFAVGYCLTRVGLAAHADRARRSGGKMGELTLSAKIG
jgi:hypothetical protein